MTGRISALSLGLLALSAGAMPLAAQTPAASAEIPLAGHINADMAQRLHAALADGRTHTLRVNSSGGEDLPALALAADISRNDVALIVDGLCAGPCANYLFLAASRRTVRPGGMVIFSASAMSRLAMVPSNRKTGLNGDYDKAATQEKQLLADTGLNPSLLLEPQLRLGTECYSLTSHDRAGKAYINYKAGFVGWIPSRAYMVGAGIKIAGFWPKDADQFRATLQSAFPGGTRGDIEFGGAGAPSQARALITRLQGVKECDAGPTDGRRPMTGNP
jgi:hypothetical protein